MHYKQLPADYALVLQQISEDGSDNLDDLINTMRVNRNKVLHIVSALHHKGLITIQQMGYDTWFTLSAKGRRLIQELWPEASLRYQW